MRSSITSSDAEAIKAQVDLVDVIAQELGAPRRSGAWLKWRCPFHEDRTPSFAVGPERRSFKCFGCGKSGDLYTWLQLRHNMSFPEAKSEAARIAGIAPGAPVGQNGPDPRPAARSLPESRPEPPSERWQAAAWEFVAYSQDQLWAKPEGKAIARPYLHERGLTDKTIDYAGLGWCPGRKGQPALWGLDVPRLILARGIVIPLFYGLDLWGVKTRCFQGRGPSREGKYRHVTGGGDSWPYGTDSCKGREALLLTEGEFDQLLAWQEAGDLLDVLAMKSLRREWLSLLLPYPRILAAYDRDRAGAAFGRALTETTARVHLVQVPLEQDKADLTKFHQAGGDLRLWLEIQLTRATGGE